MRSSISSMPRRALPAALLLWLMPGCSGPSPLPPLDGGSEAGGKCTGFSPCDVIITEIMAEPDSTNSATEWLEIYNNSGRDIASLQGLSLFAKSKECRLSGPLGAGKFLVVHRGVDGGPGGGLVCKTLSLNNSASTLKISCGGVIIHQVDYGSSAAGPGNPKKGKSQQLSAHLFTGKPIQNCSAVTGNPANWCDAEHTYDGKNMGTPGSKNLTTCPGGITCSLKTGELLVSEILFDPKESPETGHEWFEVYNNTTRSVNLQGLVLKAGKDPASATGYTVKTSVPLASGKFLAIGRGSSGDGGTGGVPLGYVWSKMPSLTNSGAGVRLECNGALVAELRYQDGTGGWKNWKTNSGAAIQLDQAVLDAGPGKVSYTRATAPGSWCAATRSIAGTQDLGTPGAPNGYCLTGDGGVPDGAVPDGGTGTAFAAGELLVTEIMYDPKGTEKTHEWFEIYNNTTRTVDLLGLALRVGSNISSAKPHTISRSQKLSPGGYLAIIRSTADPALKGYVWSGMPYLANSGSTVRLESRGKTVFEVTYKNGSGGWPKLSSNAGKSIQLSGKLLGAGPGKVSATAAAAPANWSAATTSYGTEGNMGTPGSANTN